MTDTQPPSAPVAVTEDDREAAKASNAPLDAIVDAFFDVYGAVCQHEGENPSEFTRDANIRFQDAMSALRHRLAASTPGAGPVRGTGVVREAAKAALVTLRHARVFIGSRQRMHPEGQVLYDADVTSLEAALALPTTPPPADNPTDAQLDAGLAVLRGSTHPDRGLVLDIVRAVGADTTAGEVGREEVARIVKDKLREHANDIYWASEYGRDLDPAIHADFADAILSALSRRVGGEG